MGYGLREVALLVTLGYLIGAIFNLVLPPAEGAGGAGLAHIFGLLNWVIGVLLLAWLAWLPPRLFGGQGSWGETLRATAWLSVLINLLWPLLLFAIRLLPDAPFVDALQAGDLAAIVNLVESLAPPDKTMFHLLTNGFFFGSVWLFASFVAEIHGFRRTWLVLLTIFGVIFGPSMFLTLIG
ncbi:MAG: hypothetical protein AAF317_21565, partial [Pseudomonadota bacterium]